MTQSVGNNSCRCCNYASRSLLLSSGALSIIAFIVVTCRSTPARALDETVPRIRADRSSSILGIGTDVVVGIVDSGIDDTHPALNTLDSRGRPRLVSERNFVAGEPLDAADDMAGHGTGVAGVILGQDFEFQGVAPGARYVNARALDDDNSFESGIWPENATGWIIEQDVDVINVSLNFFSTSDSSSQGLFTLDRMLDWAAFERALPTTVCVGNLADADGGIIAPRSPGGSFNTIAVGQTGPNNYGRLHVDSSYGPTADGRLKPDIVAPGRSIAAPSHDWETGLDFVPVNGCSFAAPHVTGILAQLIGYGKQHSLSTHPMLFKATLLNSAEKVQNVDGRPWQPHQSAIVDGVWQTIASLDQQTGAGQVDALAAAYQYLAGSQATGPVARSGWSLATVEGQGRDEYTMTIEAGPNTVLTSTLTWMRHVRRNDNGDDVINSADQFETSFDGGALDNLDLILLYEGKPVARSISHVDNVEHIRWNIQQSGQYTLRVTRHAIDGAGDEEQYALAWYTNGFFGDFDEDGVVSATDMDLLTQHVRIGANDIQFDLNLDGEVDQEDRERWVAQVAGTFFGDSNLDGEFNSQDLTQVFQAGQFDDEIRGNSTWATGDWNGDAEFDTSDVVTAFQSGRYEQGPRRVVPEPSCAIPCWIVLIGHWAVRGKRRQVSPQGAQTRRRDKTIRKGCC